MEIQRSTCNKNASDMRYLYNIKWIIKKKNEERSACLLWINGNILYDLMITL